jgi:hypothetical protein
MVAMIAFHIKKSSPITADLFYNKNIQTANGRFGPLITRTVWFFEPLMGAGDRSWQGG